MVAKGIMTLTGAATVSEAWQTLMPYQPGDAVAIKINCNNHYACENSDEQVIDAYPEVVNAVIDGLTLIIDRRTPPPKYG